MNDNYKNNSPINPNYNNMDFSKYNNIRSNCPAKKEKKKLDFKSMKKNTISSLNDVEYFLTNLGHTIRYIKLFKLLK